MKIAAIILGILVGIVVLIAITGALLPRQHVATRSKVVHAAPQAVYAAIRNVADAPRWRNDVKRVEILSPTRFREHGEHGAVTYDIVEDTPPSRLVTRIADRDLGYSGSWTYNLAPDPEGTLVTITENGDVPNVVFRALGKFVFGHATTIENYLGALSRQFP
jgi:hypothetical protein